MLQKEKGHVAGEMMETGNYDRKQKEGNDNADEVAGKGSLKSQSENGSHVLLGGSKGTGTRWSGYRISL